MSVAAAKLVTADELLQMTDVGRCELIEGEIIPMAPAGGPHGSVAYEISFFVGQFVRAGSLGRMFAAETGFILSRNPDTVRAPDVAFIPGDRVRGPIARGFLTVIPALVVEVTSPDDAFSDVEAKVQQWLAFGVTSVWVADPRTKSITVHHASPMRTRFAAGEILTDDAALPGFKLDVAEVFR